jgi:hypothetical protein
MRYIKQTLTETHDITIIRMRKPGPSSYCESCGTQVMTYTADQIRTWLLRFDSGQAHLIAAEGGSRICANSLEGKTN